MEGIAPKVTVEKRTPSVLCGEVDGQRHWMVKCEYDACTRIRSMTKDRMNEIAEELACRENHIALQRLLWNEPGLRTKHVGYGRASGAPDSWWTWKRHCSSG